jgi:hypothetical protein
LGLTCVLPWLYSDEHYHYDDYDYDDYDYD